jgi:DnaJ-class molecular chaperone
MACSDLQTYQKRDVLGYYRLLNVSPEATQVEIRKAFYALAKVYHPDKNNSQEAEVVVCCMVLV